MKISTSPTNLRRIVCAVFSGLFWISVWSAAAYFVGKPVLLPSPYDVFLCLFSLMRHGEFWFTILSTLIRILLGYVFGVFSGVLLAVICFRLQVIDIILSPILSIIRAVPVASFIILALVWIGRPIVPSFIAYLMVLPIVFGNMKNGLESADPRQLEVMKIYRSSTWDRLRYLHLPASLPYFQASITTSLGMAWKAGVAAEVLCSLSSSIGGNIYESKLYLETDDLFAWTFTVIVISMLIEKLLQIFISKKNTGGSPREN